MSAKRQPNPTWLVRDARHPLLAMRHKCVLFAMASRMANPGVEVFPTIPTLAADCAMSPASVKASLADLVRWEILERMTRPCAKGRRNFYRVNWAALSATSDHGPPDETGDYPDPSDDGEGGGPDSGSSHGVGGPGSGSSTREVGQDLAHGVGQDLADPPGGGGPGSGPKEETVKEEIREAPKLRLPRYAVT